MSLLAGAFTLTACDPAQESVDNNTVMASSEQLINGVSFIQYADAEMTSPAEDGNYIAYTTNPGRQVQIYNLRADGSMNLLASGASGSFTLRPTRGSNPVQTIYVRHLNSDGSMTVSETTLTVYVKQDLDPEIKFLASNDYGKKTWKWDTSITGTVWGNMGYCGGKGSEVGISGNGQWWGVSANDDPDGAGFNQQLQHSEGGVNHGDGDLDAYMVIDEDGLITSYDKDGNVVRSGSYEVLNYDPSDPEAWKIGDLKTDAILWPWVINSGAKKPSECGWGTGAYEIVYLTADKMTLVYPGGNADTGEANALGGWGEATYWHFSSNTDLTGMLAGYDTAGKAWTWDTSVTGTVWGNMGYCGGSGADVGISGNGQWWGVSANDDPDGAGFNQQLQHSEGEVNHGDGDLDAYMTITPSGMVTSYAADGSVVRSGSYEFNAIEGDEWKIGELKTDAILWPWVINSGAKKPSECGWGNGAYEVVYLSGSQMTLVYPGGNADTGEANTLGGWGEATYWHFKAK